MKKEVQSPSKLSSPIFLEGLVVVLVAALLASTVWADGPSRTPERDSLRDQLRSQVRDSNRSVDGQPSLANVFDRLQRIPASSAPDDSDSSNVDAQGLVAVNNTDPESTTLRRTRLSDGRPNRFMVGQDSRPQIQQNQNFPIAAPVRPAQRFSWQGPEYKDCGLSCLHDRAAEVTSLDAVYTIQQVQLIEQAYEQDQDTGRQAVRSNLRNFCHQRSGDALDQCFIRYKQATRLRLLKHRRAILENQRMSDIYRGTDPSIETASPIVVPRFEGDGLEGKAVTMQLPTYEELQQMHDADNRRLSRLTSEEYVAWVASLPVEPSVDDFIIYQRRRSIVSDPSSEMITAIATSCDVEGCECANGICRDMARFEQQRQSFQVATRQLRADFERRQERPINPSEDLPQRLTVQSNGQENKQAYQRARAHLVHSTNRRLARHGVSGAMNFAGAVPGSRQVPSPSVVASARGSSAGLARRLSGVRPQQADAPEARDEGDLNTRAAQHTEVLDENGNEFRVSEVSRGADVPNVALSVNPDEVGQIAEQIAIYKTHRPSGQQGASNSSSMVAGQASASAAATTTNPATSQTASDSDTP